nr:MAG TPA: hypothetical protein [Caudoviricetes sp.]
MRNKKTAKINITKINKSRVELNCTCSMRLFRG